MPPALRGSAGAAVATPNNVATPATLNPTLPAHQSGDLLLVFTACRSATPTVATPAGWTQLLNVTGANGRLAVFGKIAASSSETAPNVVWSNLTIGTSGTPAQAQAAVFTGMASTITGIVDVTGTVEDGAASTTVSASGAAITTATGNDLILALTTRLDDAGTFSAPAGFTLIAGVGTTSGLDFATAWAYLSQAAAGSSAPADFGLAGASSFASSGVQLALKGAVPQTFQKTGSILADPTASGGRLREPAPETGALAAGTLAGGASQYVPSDVVAGAYGFGSYGDANYAGIPSGNTFARSGSLAAGTRLEGPANEQRAETGALAATGRLSGASAVGAISVYAKAGTLAAAASLTGADARSASETGSVLAGGRVSGASLRIGAAITKAGTIGSGQNLPAALYPGPATFPGPGLYPAPLVRGTQISGFKLMARGSYPGTIAAQTVFAGGASRVLNRTGILDAARGVLAGGRLREQPAGGSVATRIVFAGTKLRLLAPVVITPLPPGDLLLTPGADGSLLLTPLPPAPLVLSGIGGVGRALYPGPATFPGASTFPSFTPRPPDPGLILTPLPPEPLELV